MKIKHKRRNSILIILLHLLLPGFSVAEEIDCSDPTQYGNQIECPTVTDFTAQKIYVEELQIYSSGGMLQLEPKFSAKQIVALENIDNEGIAEGVSVAAQPKHASKKPKTTAGMSNKYEASMQVLDKVGQKNLSFCLSKLTSEQLTQAFSEPDEIIMAKNKNDNMRNPTFFLNFVVNDSDIDDCIRFLKVIF